MDERRPDPSLGPSTAGVHADRSRSDLADVAPAIRPSTTFERSGQRTYRRNGDETSERLETVIGALEGGSAVTYASGMAAAAAILHHVAPARVSIPEDVYHGVRDLAHSLESAGRFAIVPSDQLEAGDVWWIETPSNPMCRITDLELVSRAAHGRGVTTVCDATFATPVGMQPLRFGIDVVLHATTKAIAGHSDAMGGVLVTDGVRAEALRAERVITGAVPGSLDSWLTLRGIRTLAIRQERAVASAGALAACFDERGFATYYPGLPSHAGHDVARRQMSAMGSMLSVDFGAADTADAFIDRLSMFTDATSLGGVESLIERRALSDQGIAPGLVRISVGIEDTADLLADVEAGIAAIVG